ncbi:amino acid adenylation domain-containing protein/thioester reductase-like protein [Stackebrandtia albiflava]|uniref:Amino acid adenylation domain-containing protein/thioester reductase-like protein n=1 Tax=Stackebrandtia albiflava TaxID=406432 RepID=A0A562VCJ0_9ACTN|nr:non-ribosomal peptide synthetase [Stackebrandtia albiflava]TWJ15568.1 amino acid adenylation domain-containing protein/thioester reductase-like protein [Stackebrandtia albiflava]
MTEHPMSAEQESIWLNDQFDGTASRYVESWNHRFDGRLDADAVAAALDGIVARHESLRSTLTLRDGRPVQRVMPPMPVPLRVREVTVDGVDAAMTEAVSTAVPLDEAPLLRATMLHVDDGQTVLLVTIHHAVVDGWCFRLLDEEFGERYRAHLEGRDPGIPPLPVTFGEYARRQRATPPRPEDVDYWRERMAGAPAESAVPGDRPRPVVLSHHGGRVTFRVPPKRVEAVRRLCRSVKVTPFVVYAAVLSVLVARSSGQDDVVIGTPVSRRDEPDLQDVIACLTDVMPVRQRMADGDRFRDVLARTKAAMREAMRHKAVPGITLVRMQDAPRSRSMFPMFQVVLTVDDADSPGPGLPGLTAERVQVHGGTAKFDLFFNLVPAGDGMTGLLEYSTDLYDPATARRIADRFIHLLEVAVASPDAPVRSLAILPESESVTLDAWGRGDPAGTAAPLPETVRAVARRRPEAVAVRHGDVAVTYREFDAAVRQVAAALHAGGFTGRRIGVHLGRSVDAVVAVAGVMAAGACVVPLDPGYPADRIRFMSRDADLALTISEDVPADRPSGDAPVWTMKELADAVGDEPPAVAPEDPAYLVYTSGSTGVPKGVPVSHRLLSNVADWQGRVSSPEGSGVTAQFAPLSFDVAFQETYATWAAGGTLVLVDESSRRDPRRLFALLNRHRVARLFLPYVALQHIAEYAAVHRLECPTLREVVCAGEQLFVTPAIRRFFVAHPEATLENQYGPSETHVVTRHRLTGSPLRWPDRPPIGRPVPGARVRILAEDLSPVPIGTTGELCLSVPGMAAGYLRSTAESAGRFFTDGEGNRWYRSGDFGRYGPDGLIEFAGRRDRQVKIRGHRVEPGEVESAVRAQPGVSEAAVVVEAGTEPSDGRLVAYFVPDGTAGPDGRALRARLRDVLPGYLVPALCVPIDAMPLTPSGKVDRAALPGTRTVPSSSPADRAEPRWTATRSAVAAMWTELLGGSDYGLDDDFFTVGGDSLSAVRLLVRLREAYGVQIGLDAVFASPTVARLADLVDGLGGTAAHDPVPVPVLDRRVVPAADVRHGTGCESVLLTGATGFLGAYLLRDLLRSTDAVVHCLVRAADGTEGVGRLRANLSRYGLWDDATADRVRVVTGDLASPAFGLPDEEWHRLTDGVDLVVHSGAAVNLVHSDSRLRAANVSGTAEVLRLAAERRTVPVHHVSTVGVYGHRSGNVTDGDPIADGGGLRNGYARTKWAAERLVSQARSRGLPVSVYRPTRISGDTLGGAGPTGDYLWLLLKGCLQVGAVPEGLGGRFDLVPVDHVSGAIVSLATGTVPAGRDWLLSGRRTVWFDEIVDLTRELGHRPRTVPPSRWRRMVEADPRNAAYPLLGVISEGGGDGPLFESDATARALSGTGIPDPVVGTELLRRYLRTYTADGFLPAAP